MKLIIRDDDLSYFTTSKDIEGIYKKIWDKCPVSFAAVPFIGNVKGAVPEEYVKKEGIYPLHKNKKLIFFLKKKIKEGNATIVQHGYSHKDYGKKFEFERKDFKKLYEETKEGKEYLEKLFGIEINCFVAPHDRLSKEAVKVIEKAGFKTICRAYSPLPREIQFNINYLRAYLKLVNFWLRYKTKYRYPSPLNFGKHKEAYSYRMDDNFINNINEIINFVSKRDGLLCVTGHYRTINLYKKKVLEHIVKLKRIKFSHLNDI